MRIVSWNVHRCIGTDRAYRPDRVAEVLRSLNADLVALQEIDSSLKSASGRDQLTHIASELGMDAIMGPTLDRDYGAYGNAILSRHPILSCEEYDLSYRKFEPRGAIATTMKVEHRHLRVVVTHLGLKYWERSSQIDRLLGSVAWSEASHSIVMGDFNEWFPWTGNNLRLERAFIRAPRIPTFPSQWPKFSLDRIFLSGNFSDIRYEVMATEASRVASDHLPLAVDFSFAPNALPL